MNTRYLQHPELGRIQYWAHAPENTVWVIDDARVHHRIDRIEYERLVDKAEAQLTIDYPEPYL